MNSIDPLSSSLYFSAVTNASKEATKGKKVEKSNKNSFSSLVKKSQEVEELISSGLPIEIAGIEIEEAVAFLKDSVDSAADKLSSEITAENFAEFRMAVTNFVKYISKNNFEIDKTKRAIEKQKRDKFNGIASKRKQKWQEEHKEKIQHDKEPPKLELHEFWIEEIIKTEETLLVSDTY